MAYENCVKVPTTRAVFEALKENKPAIVPFGSGSDLDGYYGRPSSYTAWGFQDADYPIIEVESRWDNVDGIRVNNRIEYRLLCPKKQD